MNMYIAVNEKTDETKIFVAKNMVAAEGKLKKFGFDDFVIAMEGDDDTEILVMDENGNIEHLTVDKSEAA